MSRRGDAGEHKYRVLVLGACGFIGKNFVSHLIAKGYALKIRCVDKVPPEMAYFTPGCHVVFDNANMEFMQANLQNPIAVQKAFEDESPFDFVFNCAAQTRLGQAEVVYEEGILRLSSLCAQEAARIGARYIEVSSGQMLSSENVPIKENISPIPWTNIAHFKLKVEEELKDIPNLDYIIVRPATVYGPGDFHGITPRLLVAAIYGYTKEQMKLLWNGNLKMHTVHVLDLCRALWYLARNGSKGEIFNVVDENDTTQGKLAEIASTIFKVPYDYYGNHWSALAKMNMQTLISDINDFLLHHWAEICRLNQIKNTPLTPYLHPELLDNQHLNLDGSKLADHGFFYMYPKVTADYINEKVLHDFVLAGFFPEALLG